MTDNVRHPCGPVRRTGIDRVYDSPWWVVEEHFVVDCHGTSGMYNVFLCGDGVTVLAVTTDDIFVIREYKYALQRNILQLPSGGIDEGESAEEAARRELFEETGLWAENMSNLGIVHPYPTNVAASVHLFVATGITVAGKPEQDVEVLPIPISQAHTLLTMKEFTHAASLVCLLRYLRM